MTSREEALKALEKDVEKVDALLSKSRKLDPDVMFGRVFIKHRETIAAILATASEQAPVAWVIRDSATGKMVWDFEAVVFDSEGDVHEFIGQLKDDDENVEGLEPAAVSFSSPAHTSEDRNPDPEKVICPNCCHQFHAISERDQARLRGDGQALADAQWLLDLMGQWDFTIPTGAFDRIVSKASPANTSEARDAAFVEVLAREYSLLRGWSLDDWNNPSIKNRADIIADMQMAYDAAMRQEAE